MQPLPLPRPCLWFQPDHAFFLMTTLYLTGLLTLKTALEMFLCGTLLKMQFKTLPSSLVSTCLDVSFAGSFFENIEDAVAPGKSASPRFIFLVGSRLMEPVRCLYRVK